MNDSPKQPQESAPAQALLDDLAGAEHDVLSLASRHGLSLDGLVDWACRSETRRTVAGLCVLADAQTQLLLSRYRLVAATRLIAQATAEDETLSAEQVRKACVDLLKTELSRAASLDQAKQAMDEEDEIDALTKTLTGPSLPFENISDNDDQASTHADD